MNKLDLNYQALLQDILDNGVKKETRNGGTISVFGRQIRHKMSDGFPAITTKKLAFKTMVTELLWFLSGSTNIRFLVENGCHIWDGDAYKNYFIEKSNEKGPFGVSGLILTQEEFINEIKTDDEFAKKWGSLGKIYGWQWRNWGERKHDSISNEYFIGIDQIANLINDLKTNPDSRRLLVSAWNPSDLPNQVLPPCHYGFQVYTRELSHKERCDLFGHNDSIDRDYSYSKWLDDNGFPKRAISLMWSQRSVDTGLGLSFNVSSYGLLLEIIAKEVNMVPDELIGNLGDCHLYLNHLDGIKEQLTREPYPLPKLIINDEFWNHEHQTVDGWVKGMEIGDFTLEGYQSHPKIYLPLSN
jgi:thymidylate synthase